MAIQNGPLLRERVFDPGNSTTSPEIVHFEIYADDVDRASKFYEELLGWEINNRDGPPQMDYRLVSNGKEGLGIDGGITRRPPGGMAGVNYVDVGSIDEHLEKVKAGGGTVVQPKIPIPGVGYIAICQDTEGNPLCFYQHDETASY